MLRGVDVDSRSEPDSNGAADALLHAAGGSHDRLAVPGAAAAAAAATPVAAPPPPPLSDDAALRRRRLSNLYKVLGLTRFD